MSVWMNVQGNSNLIQTQTAKAVLIKMPKSKLQFWHPAKLVRQSGKGGYLLSVAYTSEFVFNLFQPGEGRHNFKQKFNEQTMTAEQFELAWNSSKVSEGAEAW